MYVCMSDDKLSLLYAGIYIFNRITGHFQIQKKTRWDQEPVHGTCRRRYISVHS